MTCWRLPRAPLPHQHLRQRDPLQAPKNGGGSYFHDMYESGKALNRTNLKRFNTDSEDFNPVAIWKASRPAGWAIHQPPAVLYFPATLNTSALHRACTILPEATVADLVDDLNYRRTDVRALIDVLGVTPEQASGFIQSYSLALASSPSGTVDWDSAIAPAGARLMARCREYVPTQVCNWWIVQDPDRQWSVSHDPRPRSARPKSRPSWPFLPLAGSTTSASAASVP
jgi:hypothetical protein